MSVQSHKFGPGTLSFGEAGDAKEFGVALTNAVLEPSAADGEVITTLSGETITDDGEETWILKGSVLQGYGSDSLLLWCHENSGTTMPFVFRPNNSAALQAAGKALIRSVAIGGDVKSRAKSEFSFTATEVAISAPSTP